MFNVCRFCLSLEKLTPLSEAMHHGFSIRDIERFTSIQIPQEDMSYAICGKCLQSLKNSVVFHESCLSNDIIFQQMLSSSYVSAQPKITKEANEIHAEAMGDPLGIVSEAESSTNESTFKKTAHIAIENHATENIIEATTTRKDIPPAEEATKINSGTVASKCLTKTKRLSVAKTSDSRLNRVLCVECGKLVSNLARHTRTAHTKERKFACPHCSVTTTESGNLIKHINGVHEKKIVKTCEMCHKGFTFANSYTYHMRKEHGNGETFDCKLCLRPFKSASGYREHFNRTHNTKTMIMKFQCKTCEKMFKDNKALRRHGRLHHP